MQQVHGRPAQPQAVHAVRGLFEVGHHARTGTGAGPPAAGQRLDGPGSGAPESSCAERKERVVEQIQRQADPPPLTKEALDPGPTRGRTGRYFIGNSV